MTRVFDEDKRIEVYKNGQLQQNADYNYPPPLTIPKNMGPVAEKSMKKTLKFYNEIRRLSKTKIYRKFGES